MKSIATSLESSFVQVWKHCSVYKMFFVMNVYVQNVPAIATDLTDEMSEMVKYLVSLGISPEEPLARRIDPTSCNYIIHGDLILSRL